MKFLCFLLTEYLSMFTIVNMGTSMSVSRNECYPKPLFDICQSVGISVQAHIEAKHEDVVWQPLGLMRGACLGRLPG